MHKSRTNRTNANRFLRGTKTRWQSTIDLLGTEADIKPWKGLAAAIIERACIDFIYSKDRNLVNDAQRFIMSSWFEALSDMDPYRLLNALVEERARIARIERETGKAIQYRPAFRPFAHTERLDDYDEPEGLVEVNGTKYQVTEIIVNRKESN